MDLKKGSDREGNVPRVLGRLRAYSVHSYFESRACVRAMRARAVNVVPTKMIKLVMS